MVLDESGEDCVLRVVAVILGISIMDEQNEEGFPDLNKAVYRERWYFTNPESPIGNLDWCKGIWTPFHPTDCFEMMFQLCPSRIVKLRNRADIPLFNIQHSEQQSRFT